MKVASQALSWMRLVRRWYRLVWKNHLKHSVSLSTKLIYAFRKFSLDEYMWYDLRHNDYREYISDFERVTSRDINGKFKVILDDKLIFEELFKRYVRVPENYAWISRGKIYGLGGGSLDFDNIIAFLREKGSVAFKLQSSYGGKGFAVITAHNDGTFDMNGKVKTENELLNIFSTTDKAILCELMHQSEFENSLYPYAANTIRIVCAKKMGEKHAHIVCAAHRIGNELSKPVDNLHAGGLVAPIDLDTGELGEAVAAETHNMDELHVKYEAHPDTGAQIKGRVIPQWEKIKAEITRITNLFPYLNFVGWDVLLTDDGFCIIEGNASSALEMFQTERGIRNGEIGDIYRSYGII